MNRTAKVLLVVLVLSLSRFAQAQIGFRQITSTHPVAVQRGKQSNIAIRSNFTLDGCYQTFMDRPGLKVTFAEPKPKEAPRLGRGSVGTPFAFVVDVPADCPLGLRELRFATTQAVSSVGMLMVTEFPVVNEEGKNDTLAQAQEVDLPVAICGVVEQREDVDYFRFHAAKGQTLVFEIFAQRVTQKIHNLIAGGNYLMDSILTLYDPSGREVAQNDDFYGGDSLLVYTFPEAGVYTLSVRDVRYNGNACYTYCVEISDRPFVQSCYPLAVEPGKPATLQLTGYNLAEVASASYRAEENAVPGSQVIAELELGNATSNPVPLLISSLPQLLEDPQAGQLEKGTAITFPQGINGQLSKPGEVDHFLFEAEKGQAYSFETEAREFGSFADTMLVIRDLQGKQLAVNDDGVTGQKDSSLTWRAPAAGKYVLEVADLSGNGGQGFPYHVQARVAEPDFKFRGEYYYSMLAPGNCMIWFVRVTRLNGFAGPIEFTVENLPEGVTAVPLTLPGHMTDGAIILRAEENAKVNASLVRVKGKATIELADKSTKTIEHYGEVTCEIQSQGGGQGRWPIETQIVGVTEKMDLQWVKATPDKIVLTPGGTATIDVEIQRHPDNPDQTVNLDMAFTYFNNVLGAQLPPGVTMSPKSVTRLTKGVSKGRIILQADNTVKPVKDLPIAPIAGVSVTFSISTLYCSNPVYLTIEDPKPVAQK